MKIALVSYICHPHSGARAPIELALAFAKNHQVTFFAFSKNQHNSTVKQMTSNGVEVVLIKQSTMPIIGTFLNILKLFSKLKGGNFDVISAHTIPSLLLACWATRIPLVGCYYGTQLDVLDERFIRANILINLANILINPIILLKSLILIRLPSKIVAISKYTAKEAEYLYKRKCSHIYLGTSQYFDVKIQKKLPKKQTINLLSVSRITPYKQFDKLIQSVNQLNKEGGLRLKLTIAGSSPQPNYLKYLYSIKDKTTHIIINPSDFKLLKLYEDCNIYITADKNLFFGLPILEAASVGKPTIALNYGASKELVKNGKTGLVANNLNQLSVYIRKLAQDKILRRSMGEEAKFYSRNFTWEGCANRWIKLFQKMGIKDTKMTSLYNNHYFKERDLLHKHIAQSLKIFMDEKKLKSILDIGCGTGRLVNYFNEHGYYAFGCDSSKIALNYARKINRNGAIRWAQATKLPFGDDTFDLISAISLIEHLSEDEVFKFFTESKRVLKRGGYIFLVTPNFATPLRYIQRKNWFGYSDPSHINFSTPWSLSQKLKNFGFDYPTTQFKILYDASFDWEYPGVLGLLPKWVKHFLSYLLFSTPFSIIRNSFWLAAKKII